MRCATFLLCASLGCSSAVCPEPSAPQLPTSETPAPLVEVAPAPSTPADTVPHAPYPSATATVPAWQSAEQRSAVADGRVCFAYSTSHKQVACLVLKSVQRGPVEVGPTYLVLFGTDSDEELRLKLDGPGGPQEQVANAVLKAGEFVDGGSPVDVTGVVDAGNQIFSIMVNGKKRVGRTLSDKGAGPAGFTGNVHDCMRWVPHGGISFGPVTMVQLKIEHNFTTTLGKTCTVSQITGFPPFEERRGHVVLD